MKKLIQSVSAGSLAFIAPAETGMSPIILAPIVDTMPPDAEILETQQGHLRKPEEFVLQVIMTEEQAPDTKKQPLPVLKTMGFGYPPQRTKQRSHLLSTNRRRY